MPADHPTARAVARRRDTPGLIRGVLLTIAALSLFAGSWRTFMAPGAMHESHADFADNCDSCHLVFDGIPDERCVDCHLAIANREHAGTGFHAKVEAQPCIACHTDHGGPEGSLTRPEARAAFDHAESGFALGGRHAALSCEECHTAPLEAMDPECVDCHEDPHGSAFGPSCFSCHVDGGWGVQLKTLAAHVLDTSGGHSDLACVDCHLHGENLTTDAVCANCHVDGHGGSRSDCGMCHQVSGFTPASFDHGPCTCAFPGKHQTVECLACHPGFSFVDTPTLCSGCHTQDRPHEPLGECSTCHTALSWSDGRFDHDTAKFEVDGAHLSVSCDMCHTTQTGQTQFRGISIRCAGCHARAGMAAHGEFGACEACHGTEGFTPSPFDHAAVGFPLTGRHANAPCQTCHAEKVDSYPSVE